MKVNGASLANEVRQPCHIMNILSNDVMISIAMEMTCEHVCGSWVWGDGPGVMGLWVIN